MIVPERHLEAAPFVGFELIEPHRARVAIALIDDVGPGLDVEVRLPPRDPVVRDRVAGGAAVAAHVPDLEHAIARIVEDAVAEDHRGGIRSGLRAIGDLVTLFPRLIRAQDRVRRVIRRAMTGAEKRCFLNQKIVDEQLPADVDGNDLPADRSR